MSLNNHTITPTLAPCVPLRPLAPVSHWYVPERVFYKFAPQLPEIIYEPLPRDTIKKSKVLTDKIPAFFLQSDEERFSGRVRADCMSLKKVDAFIHGAVIDIACHKVWHRNQCSVFNEQKRKRALNFRILQRPTYYALIITVSRLVFILTCFYTSSLKLSSCLES